MTHPDLLATIKRIITRVESRCGHNSQCDDGMVYDLDTIEAEAVYHVMKEWLKYEEMRVETKYKAKESVEI